MSRLNPTGTVHGREHGTYARYSIDNCRCNPCGWAASQYSQDRKRAMGEGTWRPYVDAEPVRRHVLALIARGIGQKSIGKAAGVQRSVIHKLIYGNCGKPKLKLRPQIAEKLLAVTQAPATRGMMVDATGTRRRIQALACLGWTFTAQAHRVGWERRNFHALLAQRWVSQSTEARVRKLYDELSMTIAPAGQGATRARGLAMANNWLPPLAWDDDEIDDPTARRRRTARGKVCAA